MGKLFGGEMTISCEKDDEKGQLLCKGLKKDKATSAVLMQVGADGGMSILKERGPMNETKVLKEYMMESTRVTKEKKRVDVDGEF